MKRFLSFIALMLFSIAAFAQGISQHFDNEPMPKVLQAIAMHSERYAISFIYDDLEDFRISADIEAKSVAEAIRQAIGFYPIRMKVNEELRTISVECIQPTALRFKGIVVDDEGEPVAYATVVLRSVESSAVLTGGVTNDAGLFVLPCERDSAIVQVSCVGYKSASVTQSVGAAGRIVLQPETYTLKTVTVKAERPMVKATEQGLVASVKGTALEQFGSASEMLTHLPLVSADGTVVGHGTPDIYINGKKVRGSEELDRLRADEILSAEVITNPGAEYDASVSSVIRIKTVRRQGEGWSGNFSAAYRQGKEWYGNVNAALNYRLSNGMDFFAKGFFANSNYLTKYTSNDELQASSTWNFYRRNQIKRHKAYYIADLGWDWELAEHHSVGVTYTAQNNLGETSYRTTSDETVRRDAAFAEDNHSVTETKGKPRMSHAVNAYYLGQIGDWQIDFSADYYNAHSLSEMTGTEGDDVSVGSVTRTKSRLYAEKLTVTAPLPKGSLAFGEEASHTNRRSTFTQSGFSDNNDIEQRTSIWSLYANYSLPITERLTLRAGVRWQNESNSYYTDGSRNDEMSPDISILIPRASLTYRTDGWTHTLSFLTRRNNVQYSLLSSAIDYIGKYQYKTGNPYLKSSDYRRLSWSESWKWLYVETYWWKSTNACISFQYAYDDERLPGVVISSYRNFQYVQGGLTVNVSPKIGFWQVNYMVDLYVNFMDLESLGITHNWRGLCAYIKLDNTFRLPKSLTLNVTGIIEPYHKSGAAITQTTGNVDCRLSKQFLKDKSLDVALLAKDIFHTRWTEKTAYGGIGTRIQFSQYSDARRVGIDLSWKFNATKSRYKGSHAGQSERSRL